MSQPSASELPLSTLGCSQPARITAFALERAEAGWLQALGLYLGEEIVVLRRAALGGPLHVRTGVGGEFALDRRLSAKIHVQPLAGK